MNRRSLFKAAAGLAAVPAASQIAGTTIPEQEAKLNDTAYIIGRYMMMTYGQRTDFRNALRKEGMPEMADAMARLG